MPIEVFQIENLYGSNENYEFPNSIPTNFVDQNTFALRPRMSGYFSGTIALTGGHGNFCKYKGIYFQLRKVRLLNANDDEKKQRGQYALVRDMWVNTVLTKNVKVFGDLSTWNLDDPILKKNINKTFWMLEKPVEVFRTPFKKSTLAEGNSALKLDRNKVQEITLKPKQFVVSRKLHELLNAKREQLLGFQEASKHLYKRRKDIYIFGFIEPTIHPEGGKQKVINRINAELANIIDDPQRQVVKVTTPASTKLATHYAISYKDQRNIGTAEDGVIIEKIDLSKVTDIKEVQGKNPAEEATPTSLLTEENAVFDIEDRNQYEHLNQCYKLSRRFYAPFSVDSNYFVGKLKGYDVPNAVKKGIPNVKGQKVTIRDFEISNKTSVGYFYGLDRVDFMLTWYSGGHEEEDNKESSLYTTYTGALSRSDPLYQYLTLSKSVSFICERDRIVGAGFAVTTIKDRYSCIKSKSQAIPFAAHDKTKNKEALGENLKKPPGYGLLMYQTKRDYFLWERCEYLGEPKLNSLQGYSGIDKNKFKNVYFQKDKGGSDLSGTELKNLCAYEPLSKFFLDLDYFLFFHFVPQPYEGDGTSYDNKGYFGYDIYNVAKFLKRYPKTYEYSIPVAGGFLPYGDPVNNRELPTPFKENTYPNESIQRYKKIDKVLLKANLDLPESIEKGDFFISSLEYYGREGDPIIGKPDPKYYENIKEDSFAVNSNTLEDFLAFNGGKWGSRYTSNLSEHLNGQTNKTLCICSNYKSQIEVREILQFEHLHQLSDDPVQAVMSVDDGAEQLITYGHLKKKLDVDPTGQQENITRNLLAYIYKSLGYNTDSTEAGGDISTRWNGLTDEDLKSREGHLFDLVGSDGYVYLRGEDQVHFIYKDASVKGKGVIRAFGDKAEEKEISTLDFSKVDERLKNASLTAKANQINVLMFKNEAIPLKSKFLFKDEKDETPFYIKYKTMLTDLGHSMTDNFFFEAKGDGDFFDQVITVPKRPSKIDVVGDQIQFEQLKLSQSYEKERYGLKKQFLALNQKLVDIHAQRAEWDLNFEDQKKTTKHYMRLAGTVMGVASSIGSAGLGIYKGVQAVRTAAAGLEELDPEDEGYAKDKKALEKDLEKATTKRNKSIWKLLKPTVRLNNAKAIASRILDYEYGQQERDERVRRIQEDKDIASYQVALNTMGVDLSHFEAMRQRSLNINALSNQYYQDTFNERAIVDAGVEEKQIGGDIYLITMIPSEAQLKYIEDYRKHYGVQCEIPDQKIILRSGMAPNVIRFRNIEEGGIEGVDDLIEREWLKNRLLAQVKIVGEKTGEKYLDYFDHQVIKPIVIHDVTDEKTIEGLKVGLEETKKLFDIFGDLEHDKDDEEKLRKDLEKLLKLREEIEQKAEQIKGETAKDPFLVNPYGANPTDVIDRFIKLTRGLLDSYQEKDKLQKDHVAQLEQAKELLEKECQQSKADLQEKIKELQEAKDKAEDERDKCREETTKAHEKERQLLNRAEEAEKSVKELQKQLAECGNTDDLEQELEEEQQKNTDLKNKLIQLAAINNNWVKFARDMGYKTAPVASSNFDYTEEQIQTIKEKTDEIVKEFGNSKIEFEKLKKELEVCKTRPAGQGITTRTSGLIGDYRDLIKFFHDNDYDFDKIYEKVTNTDFYGFTPYEFGDAIDACDLQFRHQTINELRALKEDDISFLPKENEQLKIHLLTDKGQQMFRWAKGKFVMEWFKSMLHMRMLEADIRKYKKPKNPEKLKFIAESGDPFYLSTEGSAFRYLITTDGMMDGYVLGSGKTENVPIWQGDNASKISTVSIRTAKNFLVSRYSGNWRDGNKIYYSQGYYDLNQQGRNGTPAQFFLATMRYIFDSSTKPFSNLNKEFLGANVFAGKPLNGTINVGSYKGFRDKKYLPLYPISLYHKLCTMKEYLEDGKLCCETVSLGTMKNVERFTGGVDNNYKYRIKYHAMLHYKILFENEELEVAEEEVASRIKTEVEEYNKNPIDGIIPI